MRILILGSSGYVGQHLLQSLISDGIGKSVAATARSDTVLPDIGHSFKLDYNIERLDLSKQCTSIFKAWKPDVVVNCVAQASLGACEKDPTVATRVNCPLGLLDAIRDYCASSILVVHLSTDIVFDGAKPGDGLQVYSETDAAAPLNVYGRSKAAMDFALLTRTQRESEGKSAKSSPSSDAAAAPPEPDWPALRAIVLRPTNIIGEPAPRIHRPKFLQWLADRLRDRRVEEDGRSGPQEQTKCFSDELRSYVYVGDVVALIKRAVLAEAQRLAGVGEAAAGCRPPEGAAGGGGGSGEASAAGGEGRDVAEAESLAAGGIPASEVAAALTDPVTGKPFLSGEGTAAGLGAAEASTRGGSDSTAATPSAPASTDGGSEGGSRAPPGESLGLPGIFGARGWQVVNACGPTWSNRVEVAEGVLRAAGWSPDCSVDGVGRVPKVIPVPRSAIDLGYESPLVVRMDATRCEAVLGRAPLGVREVCERVFRD